MDCTLNRNLLEGYLDGELGFERTLEVEAHLASCPACDADRQSWKQIRGELLDSGLYYRAPAAVESKIRKLARSRGRSAGRTGIGWMQRGIWAGGGAAFATAALLLAFVAFGPGPGNDSEGRELAASHVRSMISDHLMDVVSTDQHTVKPWFDGKVDFAPPVADFVTDGYPLAGGRLDYLENRKVAVLVYHRALHVINLYIWPAADSGASTIKAETIRGYNELAWKKNGFQFRAVSDLNTAELRDLARLVSP